MGVSIVFYGNIRGLDSGVPQVVEMRSELSVEVVRWCRETQGVHPGLWSKRRVSRLDGHFHRTNMEKYGKIWNNIWNNIWKNMEQHMEKYGKMMTDRWISGCWYPNFQQTQVVLMDFRPMLGCGEFFSGRNHIVPYVPIFSQKCSQKCPIFSLPHDFPMVFCEFPIIVLWISEKNPLRFQEEGEPGPKDRFPERNGGSFSGVWGSLGQCGKSMVKST